MNRNRKSKQYDQRDADWQATVMASSLDYDEVVPEKLRDVQGGWQRHNISPRNHYFFQGVARSLCDQEAYRPQFGLAAEPAIGHKCATCLSKYFALNPPKAGDGFKLEG